MSFDARSLFPGVTALLKNGSDDVPIAHLSSAEVIGIYFSAQRCSREFTPVLSKIFNEIKAAGKRFEIVFVSSDRDEASMRAYFADMPWLCLSWEDRNKMLMTLSETYSYNIHRIPHLVLVDAATGQVITTSGREAVALGADAFPFTPAAASAAKQTRARKVLDLFDSGRAFGLSSDALTCDAVAVFIGNSANADMVVDRLRQATNALGARIKVVVIPFRDPVADDELFKNRFHRHWHVVHNGGALAAAILDALNEDADTALLMTCNTSFTEVIQTKGMNAVYRYRENGFPWSDADIAQAVPPMTVHEEMERCRTNSALFCCSVIGTIVLYLGLHTVILFALGMKDPSLLPMSTPCPHLDSSMMPSLYRFLHPQPRKQTQLPI